MQPPEMTNLGDSGLVGDESLSNIKNKSSSSRAIPFRSPTEERSPPSQMPSPTLEWVAGSNNESISQIRRHVVQNHLKRKRALAKIKSSQSRSNVHRLVGWRQIEFCPFTKEVQTAPGVPGGKRPARKISSARSDIGSFADSPRTECGNQDSPRTECGNQDSTRRPSLPVKIREMSTEPTQSKTRILSATSHGSPRSLPLIREESMKREQSSILLRDSPEIWPTDSLAADWDDELEDSRSQDAVITTLMRSTPGPITFAGNGMIDPFKSYPATALDKSSVAKLVDYSVKVLWPALLPNTPRGTVNPAVIRWLPQALANPALFYGFMYGGAAHIQATRGYASHDDSLELVISWTEAITQLSKEMQDPIRAASDENILAVVCMACNGPTLNQILSGRSPRQSLLRTLQSLDKYSTLSIVQVHAEGLARLVDIRGGLDQLQLEGLAETISFAGVLNASRYLTKPHYPFIPNVKKGEEPLVTESLSPPLRTKTPLLGKGFEVLRQLPTLGLLNELLSILHGMADYTTTTHDYLQARMPHRHLPSPLAIIDQRNLIQHRLMSLPAASEFKHKTSTLLEGDHYIYEPCRIAAIIYSLIVVFPLTPPSAPFQRLVTLLQRALIDLVPHRIWKRALRLLLWIIVMGGIASIDLPQRPWFVAHLGKLCVRGGIRNWEMMKIILNEYLWLESINEFDGRLLWDEVHRDHIATQSSKGG